MPGGSVSEDCVDSRPSRAAAGSILAVYGVQGLAFGALVVRVPSLQDQVGATMDTLALGLALVPIMASIGSLVSGILARHRSARLILRLTSPLVPVAVLVASMSTSVPALLLSLAVTALLLGAADATMAIQALVVQRRFRRSVIGRGYALFVVGGVIASVVASATTAAGWSPAETALLVAGVGAPMSAIAGFFLPRGRYVEAVPGQGPGEGLGVRRLAVPAMAVVSAQVVDAAVSTWAALFLHVGLGIDEAGAALGYGAYALAATIARLATDRLLVNTSTGRLVLLSLVLGAAGAITLALSTNLVGALLALGLIGLGVGPIVPSAFVTLGSDARSVPQDVARLNTCNYIGYLIGTPMASAATATFGVSRSIPLTAVALIGALPLAISTRGSAPAKGSKEPCIPSRRPDDH